METFYSTSAEFTRPALSDITASIPSNVYRECVFNLSTDNQHTPLRSFFQGEAKHTDELLFPFLHFLHSQQKALRITTTCIDTSSNFFENVGAGKLRSLYYTGFGGYSATTVEGIATINLLYVPKITSVNLEQLTPEKFEDVKSLSLLLQTTKYHKTRVIKLPAEDGFRPVTTVITNQATSMFVYRLLAMIPMLAAEQLNLELPQVLKDLYTALGNQDVPAFKNAYKEFIKQADFETAHLTNTVKTLFNTTRRLAKRNYEKDLQRQTDEINRLYRDLQAYHKKQAETQRLLFGLLHETQSGDSELSSLTEFLIQNKDSIQLIALNDDKLDVAVRTPLLFWPEDALKVMLRNKNKESALNQSKVLRWFIEKTFIEKQFTFLAEIQVRLHLIDGSIGNVYNRSGVGNPPQAYKYYPNPHLYNHICFGTFKTPIEKALKKQDYVYAFNQLSASVASINWYDGVVTGTFFTQLRDWLDDNRMHSYNYYSEHTHTSIIRDKDGNEYNITQLKDLYKKEVDAIKMEIKEEKQAQVEPAPSTTVVDEEGFILPAELPF